MAWVVVVVLNKRKMRRKMVQKIGGGRDKVRGGCPKHGSQNNGLFYSFITSINVSQHASALIRLPQFYPSFSICVVFLYFPYFLFI